MASKYTVSDYMSGEARSIGTCGAAGTFEEAVELADAAISYHLFEGVLKEYLGNIEYHQIGYADDVRGLRISDAYGEICVIVVIFDSNFFFCFV